MYCRGLRGFWFGWFALWALLGCSEPEPTYVLVAVHSDLVPGSELRSVKAHTYEVDGKGGVVDSATFKIASGLATEDAVRLPFSFTVSKGKKRSFMLVVTGYGTLEGGEAERELVQYKARIDHRDHKQLFLPIFLGRACVGKQCQADQACYSLPERGVAVGRCGEILWFDDLPEARPGHDLDPIDASIPDAGGDGSARDATSQDPSEDGSEGGPGDDASVKPCLGSPDQAACEGAELYVCDGAGHVSSSSTCESQIQCQLGLESKVCAPCRPGVFRCRDAVLERCTDDGLGWDEAETCASAALCNATAGACTDKACTETTRVCQGDLLEGCSDDFNSLVTLDECGAGLCDQAAGQCDVCIADSRRCEGDAVLACDALGETETRMSCSNPTPKCAGGKCVQCVEPDDCPAPDAACQRATCSAAGVCGVESAIAGEPCSGGRCNGRGSCVQCLSEADCSEAAPFCVGNSCVQCRSTSDCDAEKHELCERGTCVVQPYCGDGKVTAGEECDPKANGWNEWSCNEQCVETFAYTPCDSVAGECGGGVECLIGACRTRCDVDEDCPPTPKSNGRKAFCSAWGRCSVRCEAHSECPPGFTCADGSCSPCSTPGSSNPGAYPCPSGQSCVAISGSQELGHCR